MKVLHNVYKNKVRVMEIIYNLNLIRDLKHVDGKLKKFNINVRIVMFNILVFQ